MVNFKLLPSVKDTVLVKTCGGLLITAFVPVVFVKDSGGRIPHAKIRVVLDVFDSVSQKFLGWTSVDTVFEGQSAIRGLTNARVDMNEGFWGVLHAGQHIDTLDDDQMSQTDARICSMLGSEFLQHEGGGRSEHDYLWNVCIPTVAGACAKRILESVHRTLRTTTRAEIGRHTIPFLGSAVWESRVGGWAWGEADDGPRAGHA